MLNNTAWQWCDSAGTSRPKATRLAGLEKDSGLSKTKILGCIKRFMAHEFFHTLPWTATVANGGNILIMRSLAQAPSNLPALSHLASGAGWRKSRLYLIPGIGPYLWSERLMLDTSIISVPTPKAEPLGGWLGAS
jgi:hypothetical protein